MAGVAEAGPPGPGGDSDIQGVMNVTKEDQQKINLFAKLNARLEDIKDEVNTKTNEFKNYEDALAEAEMKNLSDEGDKLHLQVGDIMVNLEPEQTESWLQGRMDSLKERMKSLAERKEKIVSEMTELKAHLYARFGNNIHLESGP